jgi:hypothetical protein
MNAVCPKCWPIDHQEMKMAVHTIDDLRGPIYFCPVCETQYRLVFNQGSLVPYKEWTLRVQEVPAAFRVSL